jgi:hypothetical protein
MIQKCFVVLSSVLVLCPHLVADTITLSDPSFQIGASSGVNGATCTQAPGVCAIGGASATISLSPSTLLTASASGNADAIASVSYTFVATNAFGTIGDTVPVDVAYNLFTFQDPAPGNNTQASAVLSLETPIQTAQVRVGLFGNGLPASANGVLHVDTLSGVGYVGGITLSANAGGNQGSAMATADPYLYIDPSFVNTEGYTITVSPGVLNIPLTGTPEPALFFPLGLALTGVAFVRRRSRRTAQAPR